MIAALTWLALAGQAPAVNLYRGAPIGTPRYWDVQDTYLDGSEPEENFGGSYTLLGGRNRTVLLRFGDLNRALGPNKRIVKATIYLTPSGGDPPVLRTIGRVALPWGEGPRVVLSNLYTAPKPGAKPAPIRLAANWRQRQSTVAGWDSPGAEGRDDSIPIETAQMQSNGKEVAISGLQTAVQGMLDHPAGNNGFALFFTSSCEFFSSKSQTDRPRLELVTEDAAPVSGADLSVIRIETAPLDPKPGQNVTYTAHVKNVGDAPAQGFAANWKIDDKPENPTRITTGLAVGAETTVTLDRRFEGSPTDQRLYRVSLRINPEGPDSCSANKELAIYPDAEPIDVVVRPTAASKLAGAPNFLGSKSWEDWVQQEVELWNDTYAAHSYFSFAPDGALVRLRVNSLTVGDGAGAFVDTDADPGSTNLPFLQRISLAAGVPDGRLMRVPPHATHGQRSAEDPYSGLMGYGDTRFEGTIPGMLPLISVPVYDKTLSSAYLESTDLLSATDVAGLNGRLDPSAKKASGRAEVLMVQDLSGRIIPNTELLFYQSSNGQFAAGNPTFTVKTNDAGVTVLSSRGPSGPFGNLDPNFGNGVFQVQAKANGALETGYLKAWQLQENDLRGSATVNLRLNLPDAPIDFETNLATDRLIDDSANDAPSVLAPLIDDNDATVASLPAGQGSWVELDLGRDRTVGEIDIVAAADKPMWRQFDIHVYATGQRPEEGNDWTQELDWTWSLRNRSDPAKTPGIFQVAYRAPYQRFRYIRLVNRSGEAGAAAEIRVHPARANTP